MVDHPQRTAPQDLRTTIWHGKTVGSAASPRMSFKSVSTRTSPASWLSYFMVVRAGVIMLATGMSSQPTCDSCSGTL